MPQGRVAAADQYPSPNPASAPSNEWLRCLQRRCRGSSAPSQSGYWSRPSSVQVDSSSGAADPAGVEFVACACGESSDRFVSLEMFFLRVCVSFVTSHETKQTRAFRAFLSSYSIPITLLLGLVLRQPWNDGRRGRALWSAVGSDSATPHSQARSGHGWRGSPARGTLRKRRGAVASRRTPRVRPVISRLTGH